MVGGFSLLPLKLCFTGLKTDNLPTRVLLVEIGVTVYIQLQTSFSHSCKSDKQFAEKIDVHEVASSCLLQRCMELQFLFRTMSGSLACGNDCMVSCT